MVRNKESERTLKPNKNGKFDTIATHILAHLDEQCGIVELQGSGEKFLPGISSARLEFLEEEPEEAVPGTVYIGLGEDRLGPFDEHRKGGRIPDCCAADLVGQYIGISQLSGISGLLSDVRWCDTQPKVAPTQLASLVKAANRVNGIDGQMKTFRWSKEAMECLIKDNPFQDSYDIHTAWKNYREDEKILLNDDLEQFIARTHGNRGKKLTELASIAARMPANYRQRWVPEAFRILVEDNKLFLAAVREVMANGNLVEFETMKKPESVMLIESDSVSILQAATSSRTCKASMTIVRNSKGLTAIASNHMLPFSLMDVASMIRIAECKKSYHEILTSEKSWGLGSIPQCPNWYLANENLLLNGSMTHPKVKPSVLDFGEIRDIIENAFVTAKRAAWFEENGVDFVSRDLESALDSGLAVA